MYIKIQKLAENNVEIERIMLFFKKMYSYLETDARNHVSGCPTSDVVLPQGQESATQHWFSVWFFLESHMMFQPFFLNDGGGGHLCPKRPSKSEVAYHKG